MNRFVKYILPLLIFYSGCTTGEVRHREEIVYENGKLQKFSYLDEVPEALPGGKNSATFMDAIDVIRKTDESALPELKDFPAPRKKDKIHEYTGLIQNDTNYEISIPSQNSDATLLVPPHGWLEYNIWNPTANLFGYVDGKIIYHQKIKVDPKKFKYMGKSYDFVAEIKTPPQMEKKKKPRVKKRKVRVVNCG